MVRSRVGVVLSEGVKRLGGWSGLGSMGRGRKCGLRYRVPGHVEP